jgi:hypothetical protein
MWLPSNDIYEIPFTKESDEKVLAERSAPREERHISMELLKIGHSGQRSPFALEVTNQDQFLNRPFLEPWRLQRRQKKQR